MKIRAMKAGLLAVAVAIALGAMGGCVYTWRPYWWNFYERGVTRASEGKPEQAAEDFETAIGERKGATLARPKDARRVRTYGMHFIDDYFPHRELGVAYYRMKRYADAEKELLVSLEQTPSAKAKVYLNLVRGEILRQKPAQDEPPALTLKAPEKPYLNSDTITLTAMAASKNYVSSVLINGQRLFVELAQQKIEFSKDLKLKPGANEILVEAVDLTGMSSQKKLLFNVDMEYPAVAIEDAVRKAPDTARVRGVATDNAGIFRLIVDGRQQAIESPSAEISFILDAVLDNTITVEVTDIAGNTTLASMVVTADMLEPPKEGASGQRYLVAMLDSQRVTDAAGVRIAFSEEPAGGDRTPPVLSLRKVTDERVIYDEEFIFDGLASDRGRLAVLTVNGEDMLGRRTGALVNYFTYRVNLKEGENRFTVVAVDKAGNRAEKTFRVMRKIQEPLRLEARLTLALLPLQENGSALSATSQVYGLLLGGFLDCGRFNFVEREEAAFRALLTELKIGNSELADKETAVRIGRLRTAEGIVFGKTIEDDRSITIDLWLVDTESSEITFFADVYGEDKSRDELKWLVDGLVLKFRQHFPLVRGRVTGLSDDGLFIDNGTVHGIWAGMKYLILKEDGEKGSGALRTVSMNGKTVEARVRSVEPQSCFASYSEKSSVGLAEVNDPVITK